MASTAPPRLSVVMPAYNEEGAVADAVADVQRDVFPLFGADGAELIVVDDGSRDRTGAILDELGAKDPRVRVVHQPNGGHGRALRTGMEAAGGEYLFLIDSDRQIPLEAFRGLWEKAQAGDGAWGVRQQRDDPRLRLWLTRVIRASLPLLMGVRIYDANVPFKIIRRQAWLDARGLIPPDTLAPSLFLAIYARKRGMKIVEMPIPHVRRRTGTVSIKRWKLLKFCARAFRQLWAFRARIRKI